MKVDTLKEFSKNHQLLFFPYLLLCFAIIKHLMLQNKQQTFHWGSGSINYYPKSICVEIFAVTSHGNIKVLNRQSIIHWNSFLKGYNQFSLKFFGSVVIVSIIFALVWCNTLSTILLDLWKVSNVLALFHNILLLLYFPIWT